MPPLHKKSPASGDTGLEVPSVVNRMSPAQRMYGAIRRINGGDSFAISWGAISGMPDGHGKVRVSRVVPE